MKSSVLAVTLVLVASAAASVAAAGSVLLGAVYNSSGPQAALDMPSLAGARLAVAEANRAGGLDGRTVELLVAEGDSTAETLRARAEALFEGASLPLALIGLSDTDMVLAAAPVAAARGRLFLTSGATSPHLPAEVPEALFLACFGDNVQAAAAAEWAYESLGARTAVILYNASMSYTRLLQGYFRTRFERIGGRVAEARSYRLVDLEGAVRDLPQADMVFLSAGPDEAVRLAGLLRNGGRAEPIVGGDGLDLEEAWRARPDLNGIYFTTHAYLGADNPDPAVQAFRAAFIAANPGQEPDAFAALGYDAARLVLAAVARAEGADPQSVRAALAEISEFEGVTGKISFAGGGAVPQKSVSILQIAGGRRALARQMVPAEIPPP